MLRKSLLTALLTISLAGCATSSHVLVGEQRAEIAPSEVAVYAEVPDGAEKIAILSASSKNSWAVTNQGKMDKVVERLKKQAAKLGANGIVIGDIGDTSIGAVGISSGTYGGGSTFGSTVMVSPTHKSGQALAIFVPDGGE